MKTICFVHKDIGDIDRGGVCVLFKTIIDGLVDRGWDVSCITQQEFTNPKVRVIRLPGLDNPSVYSRMVSQTIDRLRPSIAECSNWKFELLDYSNRKSRLTKIVVRADPSAVTLFGNGSRSLTECEKELCLNADKVIAVSNFSKRDVAEVYGIRRGVQVVYDGVDVERLKSFGSSRRISKFVKKGKINIFWCGKPTFMKGFDLLENIIKEAPSGINWILNIGNSVDEVGLDKINTKNVAVLRNLSRKDQIGIWKKCDIFLSTSRVEGFGLALAEALALGLPAIVNKHCEVYREFKPNRAISYTNVEKAQETLRLIEELAKKDTGTIKLNPIFHADRMVEESVRIYNEI